MIKDGRLKASKVGREWRFSSEDVEALTNPAEKIAIAARGEISLRDKAYIQDFFKKDN